MQEARVRSLLRLGRPADAEAEALRALGAEPDNASLHALYAEALWHRDRRAALGPAQRAVALAPDDPDIVCTLVLAQWKAGELPAAFNSSTVLRSMAPEMPDVYTFRAGILLNLGAKATRLADRRAALAEAQANAEHGLTLAPHWSEAHAMLARVLWTRGQPDAARIAVDRALALDPDRDAHHILRGDLLSTPGNLRDASSSYIRAVRAEPDGQAAARLRKLDGTPYVAWAVMITTAVAAVAYVGAITDGNPLAMLVTLVVGCGAVFIWHRWNRNQRRAILSDEAVDALDQARAIAPRRRWNPLRPKADRDAEYG